MEAFCKHAEDHLSALNIAEEEAEEADGEFIDLYCYQSLFFCQSQEHIVNSFILKPLCWFVPRDAPLSLEGMWLLLLRWSGGTEKTSVFSLFPH